MSEIVFDNTAVPEVIVMFTPRTPADERDEQRRRARKLYEDLLKNATVRRAFVEYQTAKDYSSMVWDLIRRLDLSPDPRIYNVNAELRDHDAGWRRNKAIGCRGCAKAAMREWREKDGYSLRCMVGRKLVDLQRQYAAPMPPETLRSMEKVADLRCLQKITKLVKLVGTRGFWALVTEHERPSREAHHRSLLVAIEQLKTVVKAKVEKQSTELLLSTATEPKSVKTIAENIGFDAESAEKDALRDIREAEAEYDAEAYIDDQ